VRHSIRTIHLGEFVNVLMLLRSHAGDLNFHLGMAGHVLRRSETLAAGTLS
jgi:hypothetical protein